MLALFIVIFAILTPIFLALGFLLGRYRTRRLVVAEELCRVEGPIPHHRLRVNDEPRLAACFQHVPVVKVAVEQDKLDVVLRQ